MQELEVQRYLHDFPTQSERTKDSLGTSERIIRFTVMTAFMAILGIEAWLLWQVSQLF